MSDPHAGSRQEYWQQIAELKKAAQAVFDLWDEGEIWLDERESEENQRHLSEKFTALEVALDKAGT